MRQRIAGAEKVRTVEDMLGKDLYLVLTVGRAKHREHEPVNADGWLNHVRHILLLPILSPCVDAAEDHVRAV